MHQWHLYGDGMSIYFLVCSGSKKLDVFWTTLCHSGLLNNWSSSFHLTQEVTESSIPACHLSHPCTVGTCSYLWLTIVGFSMGGVGLATGMVPAMSGLMELSRSTTTTTTSTTTTSQQITVKPTIRADTVQLIYILSLLLYLVLFLLLTHLGKSHLKNTIYMIK